MPADSLQHAYIPSHFQRQQAAKLSVRACVQGYGRLGGLGEADARALWSRQNMPADTFQHVWVLSDLDGNRLLSKSEFCLFMYLMHALRNFGTSFRLPEYITPEQATRLLGFGGTIGGAAQGTVTLLANLGVHGSSVVVDVV